MGGSGGGTTTSTTEATPEVRALQQFALPQIQQTLEQLPLSSFAQWMPRAIAGSNPFYEAAFGAVPSLAASMPAMKFLWGDQGPSVFPGMGLPNVGAGPYGPPTTTPPPPSPLANIGMRV
jgi:hypothetical protein